MFKKIWKYRVEFFPYVGIFIFWFLGSVASSFKVANRPGIILLGLVSIPSLMLVVIAAVKTYGELPDN